MGAASSVLHPVVYMEFSCQHRILKHGGKGQGWVLACAVRDCQVLHILFLWEMEAGNHQVSYFNDNGVKSMGIPYSGCHFRKFAYSVLYPLCFVPA